MGFQIQSQGSQPTQGLQGGHKHNGKFKAAVEQYKAEHQGYSDAEAVQAVKSEFQAQHAGKAEQAKDQQPQVGANVPPQGVGKTLDIDA